MRISYAEPLSSAWLRMKILLFRPFDLAAWFGLGFTAFLASLMDGGASGGGNSGTRFQKDLDLESMDSSFENLGDSIGDTFRAVDFNGLGLGLMVLMGILILVIGVVVLYLSSRGRFMFLDNLVKKRSAVVKPWRESGKLAESLFLWQIVFFLATMMTVGVLVGIGALMFMPAILGDSGWGILVPLAVLFGTVGFIVIVTLVYIDFFLTAYVVPIMYQHQVSCMRGWGIFLALFREHPGSFVLSGLFYLLVSIAFSLAMLLFGIVTCCIGLLVLAIPYIGTVLTLPVSVTMRYYTVDFLGQFGDDYRLLGPAADKERNLIEFDSDGTVIGPEDVGEDGGGDQPRPQG